MKPRPDSLQSVTFKLKAPEGTAYITICNDGDGPFEVFVNVGRAGSAISALSEAIGRLCSLYLRTEQDKPRQEKAKDIIAQLIDIGSTDSHRGETASLPDAIAQALARHEGLWENGENND